MAYQIYLGGELMPITPEKITTKYKGNNEEVDLISGKHINRINAYDLTQWEMTLLIPAVTYPFANNIGITRSRDYYLNHFYTLAAEKRYFNMLIVRTRPDGTFDYGDSSGLYVGSGDGNILINTGVTLEEYTVTDDAEQGFDLEIDVVLKKWIGYGTQKVTIDSSSNVTSSTAQARVDTYSTPKTYTVKSGDTLYNICKAQLGDGSKYKEIAQLNNIANANLIYVGQVLRLE